MGNGDWIYETIKTSSGLIVEWRYREGGPYQGRFSDKFKTMSEAMNWISAIEKSFNGRVFGARVLERDVPKPYVKYLPWYASGWFENADQSSAYELYLAHRRSGEVVGKHSLAH